MSARAVRPAGSGSARGEAGRCSLWIIVLSWNRRQDTLDCLTSLEAQRIPEGVEARILVVDNGSTDGSVEAIRAAHPRVRIHALPANVGYARGVNAGLRRALEAGADWTLLVNNDTQAEPELIAGLMAAAEAEAATIGSSAGSESTPPSGSDPASRSDAKLSMLAPTIVYHDRPEEVWPSAGWRRKLTLAAFDSTADPPSPAPYPVDWATGCCLLVRSALWREVGLFDPGFRVYFEDHDLCLRARAAGWRILHVPPARIRHKVARSTGAGSPDQLYLLARSSVRYYHKHSRGLHRLLLCLYRAGSLLRTLVRCWREGRPRAGRAYLRGLRDGLRDLRAGPDRRDGWPPSTDRSIAET